MSERTRLDRDDSTPMTTQLPEAPECALDQRGVPRTGTYHGYCRDTDLANLEPRDVLSSVGGDRLLREKRWQWFAVADPEIACGGTLLDAGYATVAFFWVFDREAGRMIADRTEWFPPFSAQIADDPSDGESVRLRGFGSTFELERDDACIHLEVEFGELFARFELELGGVHPLTAISEFAEGGAGVTQKETCLPATGSVDVNGRAFDLDERARGMLDYTHGILPREMRWYWAIAGGRLDDGTSVGFNLSKGVHGSAENAVWLGDELRTLGSTEVTFDPGDDPREDWHLHSEDGSLDLTLAVEGVRRHDTSVPLISSTYLQPLGRWHGRLIDREAHDLFGVAERHEARW